MSGVLMVMIKSPAHLDRAISVDDSGSTLCNTNTTHLFHANMSAQNSAVRTAHEPVEATV